MSAAVQVGAGFDPAFRSDACAGCVILASGGHYYVAATFERSPRKGLPLVPSVVTREFGTLAKSYGARQVVTDSFYVESVREHIVAAGLTLVEAPGGQQGKARVHIVARELLHAGVVHIPASQRRLIQQLREVLTKPLPGGGVSITAPRKRGGHGDLASAFVLALWRAEHAARVSNTDARVISIGSVWSDTPGLRVHGTRRRGKDYSLPYEERTRRFFNQE